MKILFSIKKNLIKFKLKILYKLGLGCETADMLRARGVKVGERLQNYGIIDNGHGYLVTIGDDVTISSARILTHDGSTQIWTGYSKIGRVKIGNRVFIGAGAIVLPNVEIGDDVIIGAGTVVNRDIPSNSVAVGNPVKIIGQLDEYIVKNRELMMSNVTWNTYWKDKGQSEINEIKIKLQNGGWGFDI